MNKKTLIIIIISTIVILMTSGIIFLTITHAGSATTVEANNEANNEAITATPSKEDNDYTYIPPTKVDQSSNRENTVTPTEVPFFPATDMDLDPTSITVFVNKEHTLSKNYIPADMVIPNIYFDLTYHDERTMMRPEAANAIEALFEAAKKAGYNLCGVSGYRSYARQYKIFIDNIVTKGKEHTLKYSAVPGTSEHQTGLAMDISSESLHYGLTTDFATSPEGKWVAENAHLYGFIIRYPEGKADITGYAYEPWHIRYLGKGLANYLYENNLTLEEYYHYTPSADFNFEALYADLINYTPPTITISGVPPEADGVVIGENGEIIEGELGEDIDPADGGEDGENTLETPTPAPAPTPPAEVTPVGEADVSEGSSDITEVPTNMDPSVSPDPEGAGSDTSDGGSGQTTLTPSP